MSELKNWDNYSSDEENKGNVNEGSYSFYDEKEIEYLDKYLPSVENIFDESELYNIIKENNFNDEKISSTIKERVKLIKAKGDDYTWKTVKKNKKVTNTERPAKQKIRENKNPTYEGANTKGYTNKKYKNYNNKYYKNQNQNQVEGAANKEQENADYQEVAYDSNYYGNNYNNKNYYNQNYNYKYQNSNYGYDNSYNYKNNYYNYNNSNYKYNKNYNKNYKKRDPFADAIANKETIQTNENTEKVVENEIQNTQKIEDQIERLTIEEKETPKEVKVVENIEKIAKPQSPIKQEKQAPRQNQSPVKEVFETKTEKETKPEIKNEFARKQYTNAEQNENASINKQAQPKPMIISNSSNFKIENSIDKQSFSISQNNDLKQNVQSNINPPFTAPQQQNQFQKFQNKKPVDPQPTQIDPQLYQFGGIPPGFTGYTPQMYYPQYNMYPAPYTDKTKLSEYEVAAQAYQMQAMLYHQQMYFNFLQQQQLSPNFNMNQDYLNQQFNPYGNVFKK